MRFSSPGKRKWKESGRKKGSVVFGGGEENFLGKYTSTSREKTSRKGSADFASPVLAMSATLVSDSMRMSSTAEAQSGATKMSGKEEIVEAVKCYCCGLVEDCTLAFKETTRERYNGKWLCGLCGEAVKDEAVRAERLISTEEAMTRHMNFCKTFNSSNPPSHDPTLLLISAMRQVFKRSLDSPRAMRSASFPLANGDRESGRSDGLPRSESCFPTL